MPQRKKHASTRRRPNKAATAATLRAVPDPVDYSGWTAAQLRVELEGWELPTSGGKAALIERLQLADAPAPPSLPEREQGWHSQTQSWWADIWSSPMSPEWDDSDQHNVFVLAAIYDDIWQADTPTARSKAASEYRLQRQSLGLDPYARRRLEWTIEGAKEAQDKGRKRRAQPQPAPKPTGADPRSVLNDAM